MKLLLKRFTPHFYRYIFAFGLVLATVLLLMPSYAVPKAFDFYDKAQHGLMFTALTVAGLMAYAQRVNAVCLGLSLYGGFMEVLQSALTATRHGEVFDWFADSLGIVVGLGVYLLVSQIIKKFAINKVAA
jgi:VanZ family protein